MRKNLILLTLPMLLLRNKSLEFTVERSSKTLIGSAVNGEGLVNVYRGTGKILVAPLTREEAKFSGSGFLHT